MAWLGGGRSPRTGPVHSSCRPCLILSPLQCLLAVAVVLWLGPDGHLGLTKGRTRPVLTPTPGNPVFFIALLPFFF